MENLIAELNHLPHQRETIANRIIKVNDEIRIIEEEQDIENDIKELTKIRDYLLTHDVYFGSIRLNKLYNHQASYNIGSYCYRLTISGFDVTMYNAHIRKRGDACFDEKSDVTKFCIDHVPNPTNDIEERLYPHVVEYLQPYLPIKFEKYSALLDEGCGYRLRPQNNAPISFSIYHGDGAVLTVHYLLR